MWDTKYRPLNFRDVLGQDGTIKVLQAQLRSGTALDTSYLFEGGHGQGKTTLARIMARALLCEKLDKSTEAWEPCNECNNCKDILAETSVAFFERDAASNGTIDKIRAIVDSLPFAVVGAAKRIYLFDEAHRMSPDAQDVLLKPIEDDKMVAILCTTEATKIRPTIISRCTRYTIRKVTREDIFKRMQLVLTSEGVTFEEDAVLTVIDASGGHVRDIINRLEMVAQLGSVTLNNVREYLNLGLVTIYFDILLSLGNINESVRLVETACDRVPADAVLEGIAEAAMNTYRLAYGLAADFTYTDREKAKQVWERFKDKILEYATHFLQRRSATRNSLICDVILLAGGVPQQGPTSAAPVPVVPPHPAPVVSVPVLGLPDPHLVAVLSPSPAMPVPVAPAPVAPAAPPPPPAPLAPPKIGNIGSNDPSALTSLDTQAIPPDQPRGQHKVAPPAHFSDPNAEVQDTDVLAPDVWRREFAAIWERTFIRGNHG